MIASLFTLGLGFLIGETSGDLGWLTAVSLTAYVAFFAIGLGSVFWLLISEIFPLQMRGRGMALATIANWGFNLLVTLTFLMLIRILGSGGTFFLYAGMGVIGLAFAKTLVPENTRAQLRGNRSRMAPRRQYGVPQTSSGGLKACVPNDCFMI